MDDGCGRCLAYMTIQSNDFLVVHEDMANVTDNLIEIK